MAGRLMKYLIVLASVCALLVTGCQTSSRDSTGSDLMCHGDRDSFAPEVKTKLAEFYPQDEATGFSEGELRRWFWVESLD